MMCISQFHVWLSTSGTPNAQPGKLLVLIEVRERQSGFLFGTNPSHRPRVRQLGTTFQWRAR